MTCSFLLKDVVTFHILIVTRNVVERFEAGSKCRIIHLNICVQAGTAISFYFDQMLLLLLLLLLRKVLKRFSETDVRAANITPACILAQCNRLCCICTCLGGRCSPVACSHDAARFFVHCITTNTRTGRSSSRSSSSRSSSSDSPAVSVCIEILTEIGVYHTSGFAPLPPRGPYP